MTNKTHIFKEKLLFSKQGNGDFMSNRTGFRRICIILVLIDDDKTV
jgi:hypothetical protein